MEFNRFLSLITALFSCLIVLLPIDAPSIWGQDVAAKPSIVQANALQFNKSDDGLEVRFGEDLFAKLVFNKYAKPIVYPVYAIGQVPMTRNWPMVEALGEAHDHPHHKSIWFAHGDVNGVDFWSEKGTIRTEDFRIDEARRGISTSQSWVSNEKVICTDQSYYGFDCNDSLRWIDFDITIIASNSDLVFGDTKEGMMAIRTHSGLQLTPSPEQGVPEVYGSCVNSVGDTDKSVWGKSAEWILYRGKVDNAAVAMMLLDHPSNFRHPTTWHARDYGLVAANPFGLSDFKGLKKGAGDHTVTQGNSIRFRYRMIFANLDIREIDPVKEFNRYKTEVHD